MVPLLMLCLFGMVFSQNTTTHKPTTTRPSHTTREPNEMDHYHFMYDTHSQALVITGGHACYVYNLSDSEHAAVHTHTGINTLELKVLGMLFSHSYKTVEKDSLNYHLRHYCRDATSFYSMNIN